jgi:hypothetical protein
MGWTCQVNVRSGRDDGRAELAGLVCPVAGHLLGFNSDPALVRAYGCSDLDGRAIDESSAYSHEIAIDDGPGASADSNIPCPEHLERRNRGVGHVLQSM